MHQRAAQLPPRSADRLSSASASCERGAAAMNSEKASQPPAQASRTPAPTPFVEPSSTAQMAWLQHSAGNSAMGDDARRWARCRRRAARGRGGGSGRSSAATALGRRAASSQHHPGGSQGPLLKLAAYNERAGAAIDLYRDKQGSARAVGRAWGGTSPRSPRGVEAGGPEHDRGCRRRRGRRRRHRGGRGGGAPRGGRAALGGATWFAFNTATAVTGGVSGGRGDGRHRRALRDQPEPAEQRNRSGGGTSPV